MRTQRPILCLQSMKRCLQMLRQRLGCLRRHIQAGRCCQDRCSGVVRLEVQVRLEEPGAGGVEVEHAFVVTVVGCGCAGIVHVEMSAQSFDTVAGEDAEDVALVLSLIHI